MSSKKTIAVNVLYSSIVFVLLLLLGTNLVHGYSKGEWGMTELLINYQGGFVRRGLFGEMVFLLWKVASIPPYTSILAVCLGSYALMIGFFLVALLKKGYSIFLLPFVFFLGNPILNYFVIRKDVILVLLFILTLYFLSKKKTLHLIFANLFLMVGLLMHEGIGFFAFPAAFLLLLSNKGVTWKPKAIVLTLLQLLPSLLTFVIVLCCSGSESIAQHIWDSWKPIAFPFQTNVTDLPMGAIDSLSWSVKRAFSLSIAIIHNFDGGIFGPIAWILLLISIFYVLINFNRMDFKLLGYKPSQSINRITLTSVVVFQFLAVAPLFIIGWDYGRWVFFWVTTSFATLLLLPQATIEKWMPIWINRLSEKLIRLFDQTLGDSKVLILLVSLLISFPQYSWFISSYIDNNLIVNILKVISSPFHYFYQLLAPYF